MSIVRAKRPDRGFVIVDNTVARDSRLSYRARGVLIAILSQPDHWRTDATRLAAEGGEGREAIRAALRELQAAGYMLRTKVRRSGGQLVTETHVYDSPRDVSAGGTGAQETGVGQPDAGGPDAGQPDVGGPGAIERTERKTEGQNLSSGADAPDQETARPEVDELCSLLADLVEANGSKRPAITKAWRTEARRMLDLDGRDPAKAAGLIRWCQADTFWRANVLSMPTFRAQYDKIRLKAMAEWEGRRSTADKRAEQAASLIDWADEQDAAALAARGGQLAIGGRR